MGELGAMIPLGLVLIFGGALLVSGAVHNEHPWAPVLRAFGGTPPPAPGAATAAGAPATGTPLGPLPFGTGTGANRVGAIVVGAARSMIGQRYSPDGHSVGSCGEGFADCSCVAQRAYAAADIVIPRSAAAQFAVCRIVPRSQADEGDLIFMPLGETHISHVAIYAGKGLTIESAPSHGGVGVVPEDYQPGPHIFARPLAAFATGGVGR